MTPLRENGNILTPAEMSAIFNDVDTVVKPNIQILEDLLLRVPTLMETGDMRVGDIFSQMVRTCAYYLVRVGAVFIYTATRHCS